MDKLGGFGLIVVGAGFWSCLGLACTCPGYYSGCSGSWVLVVIVIGAVVGIIGIVKLFSGGVSGGIIRLLADC